MPAPALATVFADSFYESLQRLDAESQKQVKSCVFDFQMRPDSPGLSLERVLRSRDKNFWSIRASSGLRVILHRADGSAAFCYADHHDKAYDWAKDRKLSVHPQTGVAQLIRVEERTEEIVRRVVREEVVEPPVFEKYSDDYLSALGVPVEWLDAARTATQSGLLTLMGKLPSEVSERLYALASGEPVPRPMPAGPGEAFTHPDARRHFRVVDGADELRAALDAPWERWVVYLHPSQRAAVERQFAGPARVEGGAGTGKTVVALHRAARLLRASASARVLLTTYSKTLAARLEQQMDLLVPRADPARSRLQIAHLHKVAHGLAGKRPQGPAQMYSGQMLEAEIEAAMKASDLDEKLEFLRAEWLQVVEPYGCRTEEQYLRCARVGRGRPLGAQQRKALWALFSKVRAAFDRKGLLGFDEVCLQAAEKMDLPSAQKFDHVVADEVQDFGRAELLLLRSLVSPAPDDLFLCGDGGQRIFKPIGSWSSVGLDVRGRSTRLKINYRTTEQIRRLADGLGAACPLDADEEKSARQSVSLLQGPAPELRGFADPAEEADAVDGWLRERIKEGFAPAEIGIFGRTDAVLKRAESALRYAGLACTHLDDDKPLADAASVGTMHRAKGLEFKVVVVMGCEAKLLPLPVALKAAGDPADKGALEDQERNLLYVACTRARERLLITWAGKPSRFLEGMVAKP